MSAQLPDPRPRRIYRLKAAGPGVIYETYLVE